MNKNCLFKNDFYVIDKNFRIVSFNESVADTYKGIKQGDLCYEATMKRSTPCLHCPIAGNSDSDCPIYFDPFYKEWVEADFCKLDDDKFAVFCKPADSVVSKDYDTLSETDKSLLKSKSDGAAANDLLRKIADHGDKIIKGNKRLFFTMRVINLLDDTYEELFSENWVNDIIGCQQKASEMLRAITDNLVMPYMRVEMSGYNDVSTISKRLKGRNILSQKYECVTGETSRAIIMPIEYDDNKNAVKVVYGLAYSNHEHQSLEKDPLTGVYTRNAFVTFASNWINAHPFSNINVIATDIKNFKNVNSVYGEKKADELLKYLANFIDKRIPDGICARYGADQIVCMYTSATKRDISDYEDLLFTFVSEAPIPFVNLKAGIYQNADRSLSIIELCDRALMALKSIKHSLETNIAFYDGPFSQRRIKVQEYESKFISALRKKEFKVWYQPKYNPYNRTLAGAEALVRWENDKGKFVPPSEFISVFEEDGLISALDEYVFTEVCEQLGKWKKAGKRIVPVSVNLSRNSVRRKDIVNRYKGISEDYDIDLAHVPIEITESAGIGNAEFRPMADALYASGFTLHMDDFGSEHSSLNGLSTLHLSTVKFDKSLIDDIGTKEGDLVLEYTMSLAKNLGLSIVAEGVEDEKQVQFLKKNACDYVQGYYFSKPIPLEEFEKLLE